ncbi:cytochrome B6 [uncultured Gimesia sp.]|uniref:cytochrome B6 n=1 Tax=uncultured Gimesia sp. TaxID=1678688 RepID=UPI00260783E7|nr:cytochrome B6 [uncultured Gimesia sp.]
MFFSRWLRSPQVMTLGLAALSCSWSLGIDSHVFAYPPSNQVASSEPAISVSQKEFAAVVKKMKSEKEQIRQRHMHLLQERYDLSNRPSDSGKMSRGKPLQTGIRAKLPAGVSSWKELAGLKPEEIRSQGLWPKGFFPLPHPNHNEGGMLFPKSQIDEVMKQEKRNLARFDLDFDIPDHFMPEFPPAVYLTTRSDLGDVSQGKVVTSKNYYDIFEGILNPKQLDGVRLLVTPFPQQQFNQTHDRRTIEASDGVTCFDCHVNGHTNGATHLVGDMRPQKFRNRIEVPSLRGVNIQRLFGSQRALKTVEDFTEFEQRAAYFDGDTATAIKKGMNILDRGSQVHAMAEFQELLDFPPAPKLDIFGKLDPEKATESELKGQALFFGKAKCASCHTAPYYTDNLMHNLKTERFYKPQMVLDHMANGEGPIKTFPLRGIKDSPPYLHDGRLLTLEDTVEFFALVSGVNLMAREKQDLVAFLKCL